MKPMNNELPSLPVFDQECMDGIVERYPCQKVGDMMSMLGILITIDVWLSVWAKDMPPLAPKLIEAWSPFKIEWLDRNYISLPYIMSAEEVSVEVKVRDMIRFISGANGGETLLIGKSTVVTDVIGFEYVKGNWYAFKYDDVGNCLFRYIRTVYGTGWPGVNPASLPYHSTEEAIEAAVEFIRPMTNEFLDEINKVTK